MRLPGSGCLTQVSIYPDNPDDWGYEAKTSIRIEVLYEAVWFRVPYSGGCINQIICETKYVPVLCYTDKLKVKLQIKSDTSLLHSWNVVQILFNSIPDKS